ncbi:olfactory receptor 142-like [Boleophthalmus pectinirostris]|uniref:olfactory receptor 142-like n=1 Tax=Boleophthalmus pectinirostris TaxID=150288 RepID=UPI002432B143|nr:olfactory receptor 142-like [Boleophthalmus pectinirostris]
MTYTKQRPRVFSQQDFQLTSESFFHQILGEDGQSLWTMFSTSVVDVAAHICGHEAEGVQSSLMFIDRPSLSTCRGKSQGWEGFREVMKEDYRSVLMKSNESFIILDGFMDLEKYRALYFIIMFTAYVLILCSNCTIICLIWIHKDLHEPMYFFIAALLLNSVLFTTALYPKILTDILSEKQVVSYSTCLFQWFTFYAIGGAEFWLLMMMAYDRYMAICKPLQYPTVMNKSKVNMLLAVAWIVPASQLAVAVTAASQRKLCYFIFRGIICNSMIHKLHCVQSVELNIWGLFGLINVTFVPLIFNCFTYTRIFIITTKRGPEVRRKALQTCLPHIVVLLNFCLLGTFDTLLVRFNIEFPRIVSFFMSFQLILYQPLFNPIIYGLKMKKISTHLKRLYCNRYDSN